MRSKRLRKSRSSGSRLSMAKSGGGGGGKLGNLDGSCQGHQSLAAAATDAQVKTNNEDTDDNTEDDWMFDSVQK